MKQDADRRTRGSHRRPGTHRYGGLLIALALGACGLPKPSTKLVAKVEGAQLSPKERLLVVVRARAWGVIPSLYPIFERVLAERLSQCAVTPKVWTLERAPGDDERFRDDMGLFRPDAVVYLRDSEGYTETNKRRKAGVFLEEYTLELQPHIGLGPALIFGALWASLFPTYHQAKVLFDLTMFDGTSARPVWQARSMLNLVMSTGTKLQEQSLDLLATTIALQLKSDGVLPGCPERWPALRPHGCQLARMKAIEELQVIPDRRERLRAMRRVPRCREDG